MIKSKHKPESISVRVINIKYSALSKSKRIKILKEYMDVAGETLIAGFKWDFPKIGSVTIIKCEKPPKTSYQKRKHVLVGSNWYKLLIEKDDKFPNQVIDYTLMNGIKNKITESLKLKKVEYRYIS